MTDETTGAVLTPVRLATVDWLPAGRIAVVKNKMTLDRLRLAVIRYELTGNDDAYQQLVVAEEAMLFRDIGDIFTVIEQEIGEECSTEQ
jgi:hypothetical protein